MIESWKVENLLLRLQGRKIHNVEDRVVWAGAKDGRCMVKR